MNKRKIKSKLTFALVLILCIFSQGECLGETKTYQVAFGTGTNQLQIPTTYTSDKSTTYVPEDSIELNSVKWMLEAVYSEKCYIKTVNNCVQIGSANAPLENVKFTTKGIPGRIKSVSIKLALAKGASQDVYTEITIGDNSLGKEKTINHISSQIDSLTSTCFDKGEIEINISRDKADAVALYVYYITIVYDDAKEYTLDEASTSNNIEEDTGVIFDLKRNFSSSYWNTVCLPFSLTADEIASVFGEGTMVKEFTGVTGTTMNFTTAETITAGVPYLMKPAKDVDGHCFENVSITATKPQTVSHGDYSFVGIFNATSLSSTDVFIGTDGKLHNPSDNSSPLKGTRAYIKLPAGESVSAAKLNLGDITGITSIISSKAENGQIYNINGQIISKPTKGLYIQNGKKYIMK